jgi:diphosphate--fructose-6-phosphate 1-phosphotransferase
VTEDNFEPYRNQGGFTFLGRSADQIRSPTQLNSSVEVCQKLNLDGLILVGATHTLTDAAHLTEHFILNEVKTAVIAVPATIDGNVETKYSNLAIGFDTASKIYSQLIGNIMTDAASAIKYWYFIRLMGRDPSHLVLECSLQTHPNVVLISEDSAARGETLPEIVEMICDVICDRAAKGKNFGTILIPEGLLSHLPHYKQLIEELNEVFKGCSKVF